MIFSSQAGERKKNHPAIFPPPSAPSFWSPPLALLPKSFPFLCSKSLPCNLLCHLPTPLCVLGGWCHHSPNRHGYCQIHSHVSCAAAVSRSRSPHSIRPPPDALQKWRENLQMTKTNIIYVEKKQSQNRGSTILLLLFEIFFSLKQTFEKSFRPKNKTQLSTLGQRWTGLPQSFRFYTKNDVGRVMFLYVHIRNYY